MNGAGVACVANEVARPSVLQRRTFDSFRMVRMLGGDMGQPIAVEAATLGDAIAETVAYCCHRDFFVIRETDTLSGKATLHWYTVKRKSTPRYIHVDHVTRRVNDLYAEHLFDLAVTAFDPVTPWAWAPGADIVGLVS